RFGGRTVPHPRAGVGVWLLRGIFNPPQDRRSTRVRFRDGSPHRCAVCWPARFRLATAATPTDEDEGIARADFRFWQILLQKSAISSVVGEVADQAKNRKPSQPDHDRAA